MNTTIGIWAFLIMVNGLLIDLGVVRSLNSGPCPLDACALSLTDTCCTLHQNKTTVHKTKQNTFTLRIYVCLSICIHTMSARA